MFVNNISSLTLLDQVRLRCSFEYFDDSRAYGCNEIFGTMIAAGKSEKYAHLQEQALRQRNGCNSSNLKLKLSPFILDTCVCNFLHPDFDGIMILNDAYDKGHLYQSGGLADQPNKFMELMGYVGYLKNKYAEKARKRAQKLKETKA